MFKKAEEVFSKKVLRIVKKNISSSQIYEDLKNKIYKNNIKTVTMGFPDLYGRFIGKKFDSDYFLNNILNSGSSACNYLLSNDLNCIPLPKAKLASYEKGFGDFIMKPDFTSMRDTDYVNQKKEILFVADLVENIETTVQHAPRYLLKKSLSNLESLGYKLIIEGDINTTFFKNKYKKISKDFSKLSALTDHNNSFNSLYTQINDEFLNKIKNSSRVSQVKISSVLANDTPGQFSFNFSEADPVRYADNITIFKLIIKKLSEDNDLTSSFMSKITSSHEGNEASFKVSIIDTKTGNNALSELSRDHLDQDTLSNNILGGIYSVLNDIFVFYSPTVNSYKRLKENKYLRWEKQDFMPGFYENFVGVTILKENNQNKLLFNLTGGDLNPYLALFALTSSINEGIKNHTNLSSSLKTLSQAKLPLNLLNAVNNFDKSEFAKSLLGDEIHHHFSHFYNFEFSEYMNQVDEWERNRYFYNI